MPPLTITSPEIHRIVNVLSDSIDDGHGEDDPATAPMTWSCVGRERGARHSRRRPLARTARSRSVRPRLRRQRRVVRVERLSRAHVTPGGDRSRARSARPLGKRGRLGPPHRGVASHPQRPRTRARRLEAHRAQRALPHRLRREPRRAHHLRYSRRVDLLRRAQPRVDHRRLPARPCRCRGVPPPRSRSPTRLFARARRAARHRGERHRVFNGRRRGRHRRAGRPLRAGTRVCSCSTKRTQSSARTSTSSPMPTCCGSAPVRKRSARSAVSSPVRAATSISSRTRAGRTSSPPRPRPPTPPRPSLR